VEHTLDNFRHSPRFIRWAVAFVCLALLFTGIAYAGHIHKAAIHTGGEHTVCSLCVQFDRLAGSPTALAAPLPATIVALVLVSAPVRLVQELVPHSYQARGPPRV
jgi:Zn-dependent protease